jgi:hypothetical protein
MLKTTYIASMNSTFVLAKVNFDVLCALNMLGTCYKHVWKVFHTVSKRGKVEGSRDRLSYSLYARYIKHD